MNIYRALWKNWELEINWACWCPFDHIAFRRVIEIHLKDPDDGDYEPSFCFNFTFICFSIEIFIGRENWDE